MKIAVGDGVEAIKGVRLRRVCCGVCGGTTLYPEDIVPNRHIQLDVVARATSEFLLNPESTEAGVCAKYDCSRRTLRRWLVWIARIVPVVVLMRLLLQVSDAVEQPFIPLLSDIGRVTRDPFRQRAWQRTAEVLGYLEVLGGHLGRGPPGLQAVLSALSQTWRSTYARPSIPEFALSSLLTGL